MKKVIYVCVMGLVLSACARNKGTDATGQGMSLRHAVLEKQDVELTERYSAAIQGKQDIAILPQVGGFLTTLCVHEGEVVKKGAPLFLIDSVNFAAALRVAEANEQAARALVATQELTYESKKALRAKDVISDYDLQLAENNLLTAKAQLAQAQAGVVNAKQNLSYTVVKSPCNGVVGNLPFREGALVSPQMPMPLTTVSDNSEMYIYFSMTEMQAMRLLRTYGSSSQAIAQMPAVRLEMADGALYPISGKVESISGVIDGQTGAVSVRTVFANPDRMLLSGGSGTIIVPTERKGVLVIPQSATYEIQNKVYVWRVVDGMAVSTIIDVTPIQNGKQYIVEKGLSAGDEIVIEGAAFIREGQKV